jgi:hypothetical protein
MLSLLQAGASFTPTATPLSLSAHAVRSAVPVMAEEPLFSAETSRRAVLAGLLGVGIGSGATPAFAGYVTSLGIETTKPSDADVDSELLASKPVQDGLGRLKACKDAAASLKAQFAKDANMNLIPSIRKEFDFSKLRDDLNTVSTVFDDQTQLTTDRLSRSILYDLTELENASRLKKGEDANRTPKKIANVDKWFVKLDGDFASFISYFN